MKCPKCGYVGFERAEKCRNCGYDFSLLVDLPPEIDLPLKADEPFAPADLEFRTGATPTPGARSRKIPNSDFDLSVATPRRVEAPKDSGPRRGARGSDDLPLFGDGLPGQTLRPLGSEAARRATPPSPRLRPPIARPADPAPRASNLGFDLEQPPDRPAPASPPRPRPAAPTAGPIARASAGLIDALILGGLDLGVLYFTLRVCRLSFADIAILPFAPLIAFFLLLDGGYLVAFTANGGQTIGKMAASIRVTTDDEEEVGLGQAIVRAFGYFASAFPAGLGFVPGLFGPSRRALHDRIANTRVVRL